MEVHEAEALVLRTLKSLPALSDERSILSAAIFKSKNEDCKMSEYEGLMLEAINNMRKDGRLKTVYTTFYHKTLPVRWLQAA